jgi:hypothetical protein
MMDRRINHLRPDMDAELPECPDPKPIAQDTERDDSQNEDGPFPVGGEEKLASNQTSDKQH